MENFKNDLYKSFVKIITAQNVKYIHLISDLIGLVFTTSSFLPNDVEREILYHKVDFFDIR